MTKAKLTFAALLPLLVSLSACSKNAPPAEDASKTESEPLAPVEEGGDAYYVEGVAGGVMVHTLELEAEVISVNQERREAVLRGPEGNEVTVKVGKDAVNFYQVKAGDRVKVAMARELAVYVEEEGKAPTPDDTAVAAGTAEKGETPGGIIVASSKVTAKVTKIDAEARTATLTFEDGAVQTFQVRPDVKLENYKEGQDVVFLITEMLALEVEKL